MPINVPTRCHARASEQVPCCGVVVLAHMWAHVLCRGIAMLVCVHGTLKRFPGLTTALPGKDTTLVGELSMLPLPNR